ncbi:reticulon-like protein B11 [Neltuma alba]|uniref:reticulon-like protein B11 n=1 Tax=Neltuma alba TaxID=207710 RepID=UPI0010A457D0|nr:reticulon-like protein B11 [Prosopis alba]
MGESESSRRISVHQALGGGLVADVLLWKNWCGGLTVLLSSTVMWYLFERAGYNLLSFVSNVLLLLVVILFFWAKAASLLNRPLPPLPDMEISEESVAKAADELQIWINRALSVAHEIAIERNLILCLQITAALLLISFVGSLLNFLTLVYICVLLGLSVPLLYDKYQDHIDDKLYMVHGKIQARCEKLDSKFLRKILIPSNKVKKMD